MNSVSCSGSGSASSSGSLTDLGGGCERRESLDRWFSFYNIATKL